ncbi:hypothetical protein CLM62_08955 [Streptomyces sp. SA15]|uniref:hypothetical protein n=1 Tax=Streptomyces sp. SA15 TaxID=934019 RepID=UPI000BAFBC69|nr:hypothetical protein CLM62_08955 [Streptomyces sp. SA15]
MNARTPAALALTAATAAVLLTACATPANQARTTGAAPSPVADTKTFPPSAPERGLAKGLNLPLETYMQDYADTVTIGNGKRLLAEDCMKTYGLDVQLPAYGLNPSPTENDANMERRYGLTDRETAATYGYGLAGDAKPRTKQQFPQLDAVQTEVLTGRKAPTGQNGSTAPNTPMEAREKARESHNGKKIHERGCSGWADQEINAPTDDELTRISEMNGTSFTESMKTPAVAAAFKDWSVCMTGKGHPGLKDPFEAARSVNRPEGAPSDQQEIALALAEIDCKAETGLIGTWFTEESKIQTAIIAEHRPALDSFKNKNEAAVSEAGKRMGR